MLVSHRPFREENDTGNEPSGELLIIGGGLRISGARGLPREGAVIGSSQPPFIVALAPRRLPISRENSAGRARHHEVRRQTPPGNSARSRSAAAARRLSQPSRRQFIRCPKGVPGTSNAVDAGATMSGSRECPPLSSSGHWTASTQGNISIILVG